MKRAPINIGTSGDQVRGNEFKMQKYNIPSGVYMVKVPAEKLYTLKLVIK
ncbi:MAG: hypothetical protein H7282_07005 [Cytophagaceae bacterium]|nr:hypothetical protein [Cytophagaceae bacterium]